MGYDKEDVRGNASNRWTDILTHFGLPAESLDGRHQPCPKCGGTDRWRVFDDFDEKGGAICNVCLQNAGDGFQVAAWWTGKKFADVVNEIGEFLGMKPEEKKTKKTKKEKKEKRELNVELMKWQENLIPLFLMNNPGITRRGLDLAGTCFGKFQKTKVALLFKAFADDFQTISGYVAMSCASKCISVWNSETGDKLERKACVGGTVCGLVGEESIRLIAAGGIVETIWKVEGPTDLAALISIIPEAEWGKHVVITASNGAKPIPDGAPKFLTRAQGVCIIGDQDQAGKDGAAKWAREITASGGKVRLVELPYEFKKDHGKDLRDFILENGPLAWGKLLELAEATRILGSRDIPTESGESFIPAKYQDALDAIGLDILCEDQSSIHVYSTFIKKSDVIKGDLGKLSKENLIRIAGPKAAPVIGDDEGQFEMKDIRMGIAMAASGRRVEDAHSSMRGIGIYKGTDDEGEGCIVICNGSHLSVLDKNKVWKKIDRPRYGGMLFKFDGTSWYDHDTIGELIYRAGHDLDWVRHQWETLVDFIGRWTWKRQESDPAILASLVGATFVQDVWGYRPQVSIRGDSNSGKSSFCRFIFGDREKPNDLGVFGKLTLKGAMSSAAGIRQAVQHKSLAICLDEFDSLEAREKTAVLKMLRTAGPGDKILMGSSSHKVVEFGIRSICWVAGVMVGLEAHMDANRFLTFDLEKPPEARRVAWKMPTNQERERLRHSIMAIACCYGLEAASLAANMHQSVQAAIHDRTVEGLACGACLTALSLGGGPDGALEHLKEFIEAAAPQVAEEEHQATHFELLDQIMLLAIAAGGQMQVSVYDILSEEADYVDSNSEHYRQLRTQLGIGVNSVRGTKCLTINPKLVAKKLQGFSPREISQLLKRIPGTVGNTVNVGNNARQHAICIPWEFIKGHCYGSEVQETASASF